MSEPRYPFTSRHVELLGHRIHYVEYGSGLPVLFLHGNPTSSYVWRDVLPRVATLTNRRGIALDLLGFGRSDKPESVPYSLDLHARIVREFVDALNLRDIFLAEENPERVVELVTETIHERASCGTRTPVLA
jgi:haloalkane dehalogenase